jgi:hypothetical protein
MEIAATRNIRKRDRWWWVPSQAETGLYRVQIAKKFATCECLDFTTRGVRYKHIFAATFVLRREKGPDGTITVTESLTVSTTTQKTYPQDWAAYNRAQTNEKCPKCKSPYWNTPRQKPTKTMGSTVFWRMRPLLLMQLRTKLNSLLKIVFCYRS